MRCLSVVLCLLSISACAVEPADEAERDQAATVRSSLERNADIVLRANGGSACSTDSAGTRCLVDVALQPARRLQIGDPIPSPAALRLCAPGGACATIVGQPPSAVHCPTIQLCAPLLVGCPTGGSMQCNPSGGGLDCHCVPEI